MESGKTISSSSCAFDVLFSKNVLHILEKIFFSLDFKSFKICIEVSLPWHKLLTSVSYRTKGKSVFQIKIHNDQLRLFIAVEDNDIGTIKRLLVSRMLDMDCVIKSHTPLQGAAIRGNTNLVKLLLDNGADPNKTAHWGHSHGLTALHWAVDHKDVVKLLLNRGAAPNQVNEFGETPLHWAAKRGNKEVVELLLKGGAEPGKTNGSGKTPLCIAMEYRNGDIIQLMVDHAEVISI